MQLQRLLGVPGATGYSRGRTKNQNTLGKYTLNKTRYTRTERYHPWDRADRRVQVHTRRRRVSGKEVINVNTSVEGTNSETDILHGNGFGYAPEVFIDKEFAPTVPCTDSEGNEIEVQHNFIGEYCEKCMNSNYE